VRNIDVLNLSIGGYTHDGRSLFATGRSVAKAIRLGVTVVAGAGNDGRRDPFYPAADPGVIAVGSLDSKGARSCFSNTGPWVDLHAIGEDVVSTYPIGEVNRMALPEGGAPGCPPQPAVPEQTVDYNTGFARWSGTSFAAARISGAIARTRVDRS
jgi:subtilisin family serine protease